MVRANNGEVHTNEEPQVFVHDLDLFLTVQLLEETPAVLSLGKLCEDHGKTTCGSAVKKPRLTKEKKTMKYKNEQFRTCYCSRVVRQVW